MTSPAVSVLLPVRDAAATLGAVSTASARGARARPFVLVYVASHGARRETARALEAMG